MPKSNPVRPEDLPLPEEEATTRTSGAGAKLQKCGGRSPRVLLLHQNQNTHTHRTEHRELDDESAGEDRHP